MNVSVEAIVEKKNFATKQKLCTTWLLCFIKLLTWVTTLF